jgi:hypothetical protein
MDYFARAVEQAAAVEGGVTYTRGGQSVTLAAWVGRTAFKRSAENGAALVWGERDYLFPAAALVIAGAPAVPQKGDRVTEGALTFEVMAVGDEPVWRYSDQTRRFIRVHVKRVA